MKRSGFSEEQILGIVNERRLEGGRPVLCARYQRVDVLPLEGQVRRDGAQRAAADQAVRRRATAG